MSPRLRSARLLFVLVPLVALSAYLANGKAIGVIGDWLKGGARNGETAKPAEPAKRVALVALNQQIPVCMKRASAFQACMYDAGYAVNPDWVTAHDKDAATSANVSMAIEIIADQQRAGPSPVYKVPFWVPRDAITPPGRSP